MTQRRRPRASRSTKSSGRTSKTGRSGSIPPCQVLAHDHGATRGLAAVEGREGPALEQGDAEGGEEVARDHANVGHRLFTGGWPLAVERVKRRRRAHPAHGDDRDRPGRAHPRQRSQALERLLEEGEPPGIVGVAAARQRHAERQDALLLEARVDQEEALRGAHQKPRQNEQHDREGQLRADQQRADPPAFPPAGRRRAQKRGRWGCGEEGGDQAEEKSRRCHQGECDEGDPAVDRDLAEARELGRQGARCEAHRQERQGKAEEPGRGCGQQALGHELAYQAAFAGSERRADRDLAGAPEGAAEQQAGGVHASDQEHERHRPREHQQGALRGRG